MMSAMGGGGGLQKAHIVREVLRILYHIALPNADKGKGAKIPKKCRMSYVHAPLWKLRCGVTRWNRS